jgi:hypothetical protein
MIEAVAIALAIGFVLGVTAMSWIAGSPWKRQDERATIERIGVEFSHYHRWLGEFPAVARVLENLHVAITSRPLVPYQDHYRDVSKLRDELRGMPGGWQQYAKDGETAQDVIERERGDNHTLLKLLAEARRTSGVPAVPPGFALVPIEPTAAMHEVMLTWGTKRSEWQALLAAAGGVMEDKQC